MGYTCENYQAGGEEEAFWQWEKWWSDVWSSRRQLDNWWESVKNTSCSILIFTEFQNKELWKITKMISRGLPAARDFEIAKVGNSFCKHFFPAHLEILRHGWFFFAYYCNATAHPASLALHIPSTVPWLITFLVYFCQSWSYHWNSRSSGTFDPLLD